MKTLAFFFVALFLCGGAVAQEAAEDVKPVPGVWLNSGEPAPANGILFSGQSLVALVNALRQGKFAVAQVPILQSEILEAKATIDDQKQALAKDLVDRAMSDYIVQHQREEREAFVGLMDQYQKALDESRQDVKEAHSELFWTKLLGAAFSIAAIALAFH